MVVNSVMRSMLENKTLGDVFLINIRQLLKDRNMSQNQLCRESGVSGTHLSAIFTGQTNVTLIMVDRLCLVLKVDPIAMLTDWSEE